MADPNAKGKVDLGLLEEDDEFEEFPAEEWTAKGEDAQDINVWEDNWDDDNIEDDFSQQLRSPKMSRNVVVLALSITALYLVCGKTLHRAKRWEEFPDVEFHFDCSDKPIGFYADLEFDCKIFHMCDAYGRRVPHICANDTAFNQRYRVCDWEYNVNCADSPNFYYLNDLTYETEPPTKA